MKLYELTGQYTQALATLDDMDLPAEVVTDTLEGLKGSLEEKSLNVARFFQNVESSIVAMKDAEKRMAARRKAAENRVTRLRHYLKYNMDASGIVRIECPDFVIAIQNNPAAVVIDSADALPDDYTVEKTTVSPDKKLIKQAIQDGYTVTGAHLETGTRLVIK